MTHAYISPIANFAFRNYATRLASSTNRKRDEWENKNREMRTPRDRQRELREKRESTHKLTTLAPITISISDIVFFYFIIHKKKNFSISYCNTKKIKKGKLNQINIKNTKASHWNFWGVVYYLLTLILLMH